MKKVACIILLFNLGLYFCEGADPCCAQPCQNRGFCTSRGFTDYECDCTRTGYYGRNCSSPELLTWLRTLLKPSPNTMHHILTHYKPVWDFINRASFIRNAIMSYVLTSRSHLVDSPPTYNADYGYLSWESYSNLSYYTRTLPPVPHDCPTPMGTAGRKVLPEAKDVVERVLLRRKFTPDPQGSNLMFAFFAQHFTHQFFKTDFKKGPGFTKAGGHGVDLHHIYGDTLERQHKLRLLKDGKLKYQVLKGEVYPPTVRDVGVYMQYPPHVPEEHQFAVGHEVFGLVPGLMMYATLWLREHNRVCDIMRAEHSDWDDERLFQTSRLILTGQTIKIVIEDYVQQLSGYNFQLRFDPELLFTQRFQYQNRISAEFNTLYHWHPLMPVDFRIQEQTYSYQQFVFNTTLVPLHGISGLVEAFTNQVAGRVSGGRNVPPSMVGVASKALEHGREMRYQSLNAYRRRFNMRPYSSFTDLTGDSELASELENLYGDVEGVELYPGLLVERPRPGAVFGETIVEMGAPFSLKGLMGNPICSPEYWKPSTFGGHVGFSLVNSASLEKLVCGNIRGPCPRVSFRVPERPGQAEASLLDAGRTQGVSITPTLAMKDPSSEL
ncbi:prostaglandin G/H synthase 2a [Osmerus mordax]|uniref:prostaglandin G/H synthase 2a n=1 Tax=Osmerus mordax TaxID=8014 RepID=UPI00350FC16C